MKELFESTSMNGMSLANRFVRSATWEGLATKDASVTPRLCESMADLALNKIGLIISGYAFVSPEGQSSSGQLGVYDDRFLPGLQEMVNAVHSENGKIALQLVHAGLYADSELTGAAPAGPSTTENKPTARAFSKEELGAIVSAFAAAALRAKQAGFDAIQLHAAHGYLLSQFLSPSFNQRTDEYGGALANRARLLLEVVREVRRAVGPDYPILVKLNSEDFLEDGMTMEEAIQVAQMLEEASVDAIELSGGTADSPISLRPPRRGKLKSAESEVYYRDAAKLYQQKVAIPLILVGGIRSYEVAEQLVQSSMADYISLSRPLICEPGLVKRWNEGDRRKSECGSCNRCFGTARSGEGVYCAIKKKTKHLHATAAGD